LFAERGKEPAANGDGGRFDFALVSALLKTARAQVD
jgi:hypothetical protein